MPAANMTVNAMGGGFMSFPRIIENYIVHLFLLASVPTRRPPASTGAVRANAKKKVGGLYFKS